jgi:hypothetical protein
MLTLFVVLLLSILFAATNAQMCGAVNCTSHEQCVSNACVCLSQWAGAYCQWPLVTLTSGTPGVATLVNMSDEAYFAFTLSNAVSLLTIQLSPTNGQAVVRRIATLFHSVSHFFLSIFKIFICSCIFLKAFTHRLCLINTPTRPPCPVNKP